MRHVTIGLFLIFNTGLLHADYLEVRRSAHLKAEPVGDADSRARLEPGDYLVLLADDQTNGYYSAQDASSGESGWIYRTLVRRYRGEPPPGPTDSEPLPADESSIDPGPDIGAYDWHDLEALG